MTRADSLAIAQALRDELDRLDPDGVTAPARPPATESAEATLARELAITDSIVRLRLSELTSRRFNRGPAEPPQPPGAPTTSESRSVTVMRAVPGTVRRVMVIAPPSRWRDSAATVAAKAITEDLTRWLRRSEGWEVVAPAVPVENEEFPAEVFVTVGFTPVAEDSAVLRIQVRNVSAGSSFGFRSIASAPHALPVVASAFRGTVREALSVLEQLRRTPSGEAWSLDMGRP